MIKTLKDLNNAGKRFWSRPNRDDAGKRAQDKLSVAQALKNLEAAEREERASQGYISRLNTARRAVALARLELEIAQNAADAEGSDFGTDADETPVVGKSVTLRASGGVVLKGKITEVTPTSYTITWEDGRKTTYTRDASEPGSAGKAKDGLPQEIADMLAVQGKMTLEQIQEELERSGWDVTRGQVLVGLAAAKAKNSGGVWRPE